MPRKIKEGELVTEKEGRSREMGRLSRFGMETKTFHALKRLSALPSPWLKGPMKESLLLAFLLYLFGLF